ncbi:Hypothetical protein GLP15_4558 [Giardia lamblia P15]|uniref:FHA domain-containing protein n=1 Tax=Giardia intestinalis (strain P15) TaxID=658858 RepID=E1F0Z3_GIAIA|nr:Hypothetical protein GLP15_4558 [Giardia lamblia P15]
MVKCMVYQDESFLHAYEIAETRIIVGRAAKDGAQRSAEPGSFFIPLPGPAISSQHLEIVFNTEKIVITDISRAGTTIKHGGISKTLMKDTYELDPNDVNRFQVVCESKAVVFKIVVTVNEAAEEHEAEAVLAGPDQQETEQDPGSVARQEPPKKKANPTTRKPRTESAKALSSTSKENTEVKKTTKKVNKKMSAAASETSKPKAKKTAKKKVKKADGLDVDDEEHESIRPSTNESFQEFTGDDSDTSDERLDLQSTDEESESDTMAENPEESDPNEKLQIDACFENLDDAPPLAYNIDDYTARRTLMHTIHCDEYSFTDILDGLGQDVKVCWCNYLNDEMKSIVEELNIRQDPGYAADKVNAFFTNKFRRTARYLMAIHRGIPILTETYLQRCRRTVLIDPTVDFPRARKYLINVSREEAAAGDQSLLNRMPENWSLARVMAKSFKYPVVFVDSYHIVIVPEAILNVPMTKQTSVKDFIALYSFGLVVAGMGVKTVKIVFESEFDRCLHKREIEEDLPELHKASCRALNPNLHLDALDDRIIDAAMPAKETDGIVILIVPPPDSPHYEKYRKFKGVYDDTGLTFIQMKRQGVINSILLGEPAFREQYVE